MFGIFIGLIGVGLVVTGVMCLTVDSARRQDAQEKARAKQEHEKVAV